MLLVQDAKVMLLDEPVAGMSAEEREETGALLQAHRAERTIVVIEHDMEFVRQFADKVTVMHAGKVLTEGTVAEIQADPRVQEVYLGRTADAVVTRSGCGRRRGFRRGGLMLELEGVSVGYGRTHGACTTSTSSCRRASPPR